MDNVKSHAPLEQYQDVELALDSVLPKLDERSVLIIFGSFFTVAAAIKYWKK
jgi:dihydrofolate synthase/folylpolyglutamate synthase